MVWIYFQVFLPTMARANFQIYTAQITGKCICETFPPLLHDLIIRPQVKQTPHKISKKSVFPHVEQTTYDLSSRST